VSADSRQDAQTVAALPPAPRALSSMPVPEQAEAWLEQLSDLDSFMLEGRDPSRLRIVTVLLHGNEPSGLRALHRWLAAGEVPAVRTWCIVGAVRAARSGSGFEHRFLPEDGDLNRCWVAAPAGPSARAERVARLRQALLDAPAEMLIDLHNNTGHNPAYGVSPDRRPRVLGLTSCFGSKFVHSPLALGTLVEATMRAYPSVTIECGRAGDPAADEIAYRGLREFLAMDRLEALDARAERVEVLVDPIRVTARAGTRLCFAHEPRPDCELTLDPDLDRHNFERIAPDTLLGWLRDGELPLCALDGTGKDRAQELFDAHRGQLRARGSWVPVMMTTDPRIAHQDCLFYVVRPEG